MTNPLTSQNPEATQPFPDSVQRVSASGVTSDAEPLPRSPNRLARDTFSMLFTLTEKQPWLKEKHITLCDLIDDCAETEQQVLICKLLQRFTFLDGNSFNAGIQSIADYIQNTLHLQAETCSISASDNGKYADSSQLVVYNLKAAKWNSIGWNTTSFVASLSALVEDAPKGNLVIVDEFIGTGETAEKKVKWIREKLSASGHHPKIYFAVIAGMEMGITRLRPYVDDIFAVYALRRGISDMSSPDDASTDISNMKKLEENLGSKGRRGLLNKHSLGYKGSETLYARAYGNTPNNVFPIFWWEVTKNGSHRSTLLSCI